MRYFFILLFASLFMSLSAQETDYELEYKNEVAFNVSRVFDKILNFTPSSNTAQDFLVYYKRRIVKEKEIYLKTGFDIFIDNISRENNLGGYQKYGIWPKLGSSCNRPESISVNFKCSNSLSRRPLP